MTKKHDSILTIYVTSVILVVLAAVQIIFLGSVSFPKSLVASLGLGYYTRDFAMYFWFGMAMIYSYILLVILTVALSRLTSSRAYIALYVIMLLIFYVISGNDVMWWYSRRYQACDIFLLYAIQFVIPTVIYFMLVFLFSRFPQIRMRLMKLLYFEFVVFLMAMIVSVSTLFFVYFSIAK